MDANWIKEQFAAHPEKKQVDLADALGVKPDKVSKILSGTRRIQANELPIIEAFFSDHMGMPARQGSSKTETSVIENLAGSVIDFDGTEFARIPVYDVRLSAGGGASNYDETPIDFYTIGMSMLRDFTDAPVKRLAFVKVKGDSMEPLFTTGDWVLVDTRETHLATPAVYAFVNDGEAVIKHASQHMETGAVTLISHNPKYEPQTITRPECLHVIGRIVLSIRKH